MIPIGVIGMIPRLALGRGAIISNTGGKAMNKDFDDWVSYWSKRISEAWVRQDSEEEEWLRLEMTASLKATDSLKVKRLMAEATLPTRGTEKSAGIDLYSAEQVIVEPGRYLTVETGIAVAIPVGQVGLIWPRSGWAAKYGIDTLAGVIDCDYRGGIGVVLVNHGDSDFQIDIGDRIAQLVIQPYSTFDVVEAASLPTTERGAGGFGSTGA